MELSTLSLLLSIGGLFFPPLSVVGIVLSKKSLRQEGYSPTARAAVIIGWVGVVLWIISCCLFLLVMFVIPFVFSQDFSSVPYQSLLTPSPQPTETIVPTPSRSQWQLGIVCEDRGGARVVSVLPHSPAEKMGIQEGDVIININRAKGNVGIIDCSQLREIISELNEGEVLEVGILRKTPSGQEIIYLVTTVR